MASQKLESLQQKIQGVSSDIHDKLHAISLNMKAAFLSKQENRKQNCKYLEGLISEIKERFETRSTDHMNYLITKQIQEEELNVRNERCADYEQKILEQRRIIMDKEVIVDTLLRPKRKRRENQTQESFKVNRKQEKSDEEIRKNKLLQQKIIEASQLLKIGFTIKQSGEKKNQNQSVRNIQLCQRNEKQNYQHKKQESTKKNIVVQNQIKILEQLKKMLIFKKQKQRNLKIEYQQLKKQMRDEKKHENTTRKYVKYSQD